MLPDDIPTEITKLTYADHRDLVRAGMPVLSQNQTAAVLAAYWPAIEQHIRAQVAEELRLDAGLREAEGEIATPREWRAVADFITTALGAGQ